MALIAHALCLFSCPDRQAVGSLLSPLWKGPYLNSLLVVTKRKKG